MNTHFTLAYRDVVAITAAMRAGKLLSKATKGRLQNLLAARPHLAALRSGSPPLAELRALRRAHAVLEQLRAIVRRSDETEGLHAGPAAPPAGSKPVHPLRLPAILRHKWGGQDAVVLLQADGTPRTVLLGPHGSPQVAQRYREVVAEHLAELFSRGPDKSHGSVS